MKPHKAFFRKLDPFGLRLFSHNEMSRLKHKRGRKSNYSKSLNNEYWKDVVLLVRARDRKCKICGSMLYLETHHLTYFAPDGSKIFGKEKTCLERLILLCGDCHSKVHKNKKHKMNPKNFNKKK